MWGLTTLSEQCFDSFKFTLPDSLNHEFFEDSESSKRPWNLCPKGSSKSDHLAFKKLTSVTERKSHFSRAPKCIFSSSLEERDFLDNFTTQECPKTDDFAEENKSEFETVKEIVVMPGCPGSPGRRGILVPRKRELQTWSCQRNPKQQLSCASSQFFFFFQTDVFQASFIVQDSLAI